MVVLVRIWRIIIAANAHWIRVTKKFCNFSVTNCMKNAQIWGCEIDFFYRKRWFKWLFLTWNDWKGSYISDVWWISFYECLKWKIFIFFITVTKFYTFSWNHTYVTITEHWNLQVTPRTNRWSISHIVDWIWRSVAKPKCRLVVGGHSSEQANLLQKCISQQSEMADWVNERYG